MWDSGRDVTIEKCICLSAEVFSVATSKSSEYEFRGSDTVQLMTCWALVNGKWHLERM